jgi:hypothetical protein
MNAVIEQLETREYLSTSLSGAKFLDIQPTEATVVDVVNNGDKEDLYMVRVMKQSTLNFRLDNLTGDATLELINDRNHNGRFDGGETLQKSNKLMAANERISKMVAPGIYYVRVTQAESNAMVNYTLRYSTQAFTTPDQVDTAGDTADTARDLSVAKGQNKTVNEYLGEGDLDVYRINVTETAKYDIRLSGFVKDADITLTDASGNALETTTGATKNNKLITGKLEAGTYYVTVSTTSAPTPYALRVVNSVYRTTDIDLTQKRASNPSATPRFSTKLIESL